MDLSPDPSLLASTWFLFPPCPISPPARAPDSWYHSAVEETLGLLFWNPVFFQGKTFVHALVGTYLTSGKNLGEELSLQNETHWETDPEPCM